MGSFKDEIEIYANAVAYLWRFWWWPPPGLYQLDVIYSILQISTKK